jgi:hypothetical protein
MKLLTNLNLEHNELQNALMHPLSSAPAEGQKGQLYYNNVEDRLYEHNGTAWVGIAKMTDLDDYVPSTRTINGKPLTEDIKLTGDDIGVSSGATSQTVTLLASAWTNNGDGRYVQSVAVVGVTESTPIVMVDVALYSDDETERETIIEAAYRVDGSIMMQPVVQGMGTLTFYCTSIPIINIPLHVGVIG